MVSVVSMSGNAEIGSRGDADARLKLISYA